ncbi:conserved hypothetical protein [delta proteobacterium NaphS2]|nr:conserved hypothetical protein [delta proteobacterium NaphS2]
MKISERRNPLQVLDNKLLHFLWWPENRLIPEERIPAGAKFFLN